MKHEFTDILTFSEAAQIWGLHDSTLRHMILTKKVTEGLDYRKSGNVWLITRAAMIKVYGEVIICLKY